MASLAASTPTPPQATYIKFKRSSTGGIGAFSSCFIKQGSLILSEQSLITSSSQTLTATYDKLDVSIQKKIFALADCRASTYAEKTLDSIFHTNAYPVTNSGIGGLSNEDYGGLFPSFARFNSSCCPNITHRFDVESGNRYVFAAFDIEADVELFNCYMDTCTPTSVRQKLFKDRFNYICLCKVCTLPTDELKISDNNRKELDSLDETTYNLIRGGKYEEAFIVVEKRLVLLKEENLDSPSLVFRVLFDGFQAADHSSNSEKILEFRKRILEVVDLCYVVGSEEYNATLRDIGA